MAEFKGARIFLNIPVVAARNKNLLAKPKSLLLLGEIVSMLNVTGTFFMSNKELASRLDCSVRAINIYLSLLEQEKMIVRKNVQSKDNKSIIGRIISAGQALQEATLLGYGTPVHEGSEQKYTGVMNGGSRGVVNASSYKENRLLREQNKRKYISRPTKKNDTLTDQCREVVEYLRKKTGKSFKPNAKGNRSAIIPRLKEGYTVDELKKVIDNKIADWRGVTFSNGQPGDNYLTPTTLFRASKIEGYLNEAPKKTRSSGVESDQDRIRRLAAQYPS